MVSVDGTATRGPRVFALARPNACARFEPLHGEKPQQEPVSVADRLWRWQAAASSAFEDGRRGERQAASLRRPAMTTKLLLFVPKSQRELREGMSRFVAFMREARRHNQQVLRDREAAKAAERDAEPIERP